MTEENNSHHALVVGAGIAGIQTALELAEAGISVYLCDRGLNLGGSLFAMDRWFPDDACSMCKTLPFFTDCKTARFCLRRGLDHPNIEFVSGAEILEVGGEPGNFRVSLEQKAFFIDPEICIGCGSCVGVCPVSAEPHPAALWGKKKAVGIANPQMLRKTHIIDDEICNRCGECVRACPVGAIDFQRRNTKRELEAGAVIVSTGFEEFDARAATRYGYGRYPNVVTNLELEHLLTGYGSSGTELIRPSDKKIPASVAFIQCVGSRDKDNDYCSSACCMYAVKEASMIRERYPETRVNIFYMDMRTFGKSCQQYFDNAQREGTGFVRGRVPAVKQDFSNNDLLISSITAEGSLLEERYDMVVLSVAQRPSTSFAELAGALNIKTNRWGFALKNSISPVKSSRDGIFLCGSASGPADISESVAGACAAATLAMPLMAPQKPAPSELPEGEASDNEEETAVVICNCKGTISETVNTSGLKEHASALPGVSMALECDHLCDREQWRQTQQIIKESGAASAVIAACSIFRPVEKIDNIPVTTANIREETAWAHESSADAARKAEMLVSMAVKNCSYSDMRPAKGADTSEAVLVIGAGLAGMAASLRIASEGYDVELIDKSEAQGGNMNHVLATLDGIDVRQYLSEQKKLVDENPLIHFHPGTVLTSVSGYAGRYTCTISDLAGYPENIDCAAVVVAAGAEEYRPAEFCYGQSPSVMTQRELEAAIYSKDPSISGASSVVMIQCVGSRDEEHPWCSRICCSQALKNALKLKELRPEISVTVLYRDMMSYGLMEEYYTKARECGIIFMQHGPDKRPQVSLSDGRISIEAFDSSLNRTVLLNPDILGLSAAIVPPEENSLLAGVLGVDLSEGGFFMEGEAKFRPVDATKEGIFICGLAHSPRSIPETLVQAQAAAGRAVSLLRRDSLKTGSVIAEVNDRRCTGCQLCIAACPYGARIKNEDRYTVKVIESLCKGCGSCAAVCPNGAATQREFSSKQVFSLIDIAI